jgi:hypothetical protein
MAKLNAKKRNSLPASDFAGGGRSYPIEDKSHARAALSRVSANGSEAEKEKVRAAVHHKFPSIGEGRDKAARKKTKRRSRARA